MGADVTVALVASGTSLAGTAASVWWQHRAGREAKRSEAQAVLERYRGPLLTAASELGDRIDNIRHRKFLDFIEVNAGRERDAHLSTMFRFAQYLAWREILRTEVQLMRFDSGRETRRVAALISCVLWTLASDSVDDKVPCLWTDEQRAIGELMVIESETRSVSVMGYARFATEYQVRFAPWMARLSDASLGPSAPTSDRLRLLNWALYGLVMQLDTDGAYQDRPWVQRAREEASRPAVGEIARVEDELRTHLSAIGIR